MSNELTEVEQRLLDRIQKKQETIKGDSSNHIKITAKGFEYQGEELGTDIDVVVLDSVFENLYYDTPYQKDVITDPVCWAIGSDERTMGPPAELTTKQNKLCESCPKNQWPEQGARRRKECQNRRRVAVLPWNAEEETVNLEEIAVLRLPPTSLVNFNKYLKRVYRVMGRDTAEFVTRLSVDPHESFGKIRIPQLVEPIEDRALIGQMLALPAEAVLKDVGYSLAPKEETEAPKRKGRPRRSRV